MLHTLPCLSRWMEERKKEGAKKSSGLQIDRQDGNKMVYRDVRFDLSIKTFGCQIETSNLSLKLLSLSPLSYSFISASSEQKHARRALNKKCSKCWFFTIENATNLSRHPTACFTLPHVCCTQNKKWKHSHGVTFKVVTAIFFSEKGSSFQATHTPHCRKQ